MNAAKRIKLKYVADYIQRGDAPTYVDSNGVTVINQACVQPSGIDLSKRKLHDPEDIGRITSWLQQNDVLINSTGTGTLGRVAHVREEPTSPMFADGHVTIIRDATGRFEPRYLFYVLSIQQEEITVECSDGATNQIELSRHKLGNKYIDWPPIPTQKRVVAFLDRHTNALDRLIEGKNHLLDLLAEKKRTLITHAVSRGPDSEVPIKDTGIPWLGNIPAHWNTERAKWLFKERDVRSESGDEELLSVSHLTGVTSRSEKNVNMFMAESLEGYKRCETGDLVINTLWAWMGAMGVTRQPGIVSPAYNVYQPVPELDPEYIDLLVRTPRFAEEITRYSKGVWSSRMRLYPEGLYEAWLPVPPKEEQQAIVAHIKQETQKIDAFALATEKTINLLQERRSALISAAVTGQLDLGT
ncbi:restriction endonuclease subunit S [Acidovorax sp. M14]|uniref:restriction endonuclease subunit S n=1 Tax=Acidovorax sp. M14 TaxID=3411354 RepID=UPI003BF4C80A